MARVNFANCMIVGTLIGCVFTVYIAKSNSRQNSLVQENQRRHLMYTKGDTGTGSGSHKIKRWWIKIRFYICFCLFVFLFCIHCLLHAAYCSKLCVFDHVQLEDDIGYIKISHTDISKRTRSKKQTLILLKSFEENQLQALHQFWPNF